MQKVFNPAALAGLRPETLVGMEGVSFMLRAKAMPGVIEVSTSISEVDSIHGEDADPVDPAELMRLKGDCDNEVMVVTDRHIIVGALAADDDGGSSDPMQHEGQGKIYLRGRRGNRESESEIYKALGLDSYGDKDLKSDAVENLVLERALKVLRADRAAMASLSSRCRALGLSGKWADVIEKIRSLIVRAGWEYAMDEIAEEFFDERYWTRVDSAASDLFSNLEFALRDTEAEKAWDDLSAQGKVGNPMAVMLDVYEHSGTSYSLSGEGMQCRWDTSRNAGVWIPDDSCMENIVSRTLRELGYGEVKWFGALGSEKEPLHAGFSLDGGKSWTTGFAKWADAMEQVRKQVPADAVEAFDAAMRQVTHDYARGVVEEYSKWANGEVYGVLVYVIDRQTGERIDDMDDECWGYIGSDYAEETMIDAVLATVADLTKTLH